jgi:hypothetical protein
MDTSTFRPRRLTRAEATRRARLVWLAARILLAAVRHALTARTLDTPADAVGVALVRHGYAGDATDAVRALALAHGVDVAWIDRETFQIAHRPLSDEEWARIAAAIAADPDGYDETAHVVDIRADRMYELADAAHVALDQDDQDDQEDEGDADDGDEQ